MSAKRRPKGWYLAPLDFASLAKSDAEIAARVRVQEASRRSGDIAKMRERIGLPPL